MRRTADGYLLKSGLLPSTLLTSLYYFLIREQKTLADVFSVLFLLRAIMLKYEEHLPAQRNELHWNRYVKFIEMCRKTAPDPSLPKPRGYEKHHIIMRAYLPKSFWKDKENIITLTPRQHFIAHMILWKAFEDSPTIDAFHFMVYCNKYPGQKLTSKQYEELRLANAKIHSERFSGENNPMYGKTHSPEVRKRLSESRVGKTSWNKGKSFMAGENHPLYGTHRPDSVKEAISRKNRGKTPWNKGKKMPEISGVNHPLYERHLTEEQRKHLSEIKKGFKWSEEDRKRMSEQVRGENHPMYGKQQSDEAKDKIRKKLTGRVHINKNGINKFVSKEELDSYLEQGWSKGMIKSPRKDSK